MSDEAPSRPLADWPVALAIPVLWGDQDAMGHVNNTAAVRWFESSRVAYIEALKAPEFAHALPQAPILVRLACDYRRQINYPDTIHAAARVIRIGRTSITMQHVLYSEAGSEVAAQGESVVVVFDYEAQKPVRVSEVLRLAIADLEGRAGEFGVET